MERQRAGSTSAGSRTFSQHTRNRHNVNFRNQIYGEKLFQNSEVYTTYVTNHPDGTAHGGTAVIVKSNIKHHELQPSDHDFIQATSININELDSGLTVTAV